MNKLIVFLKKQKKSFIIILILIFLVTSLQTSVSFKNNKIKALKKEIKLLKDEKTNEINKTTIYSSEEKDEYNEHFFNTQNINLEDTIIKDTKERYINSAKVLNKTYDETLVGNEIYKFECMNLEAITEGQVEGAVLKLTRENFNIKIEECTIGNTVFYKIKLYE